MHRLVFCCIIEHICIIYKKDGCIATHFQIHFPFHISMSHLKYLYSKHNITSVYKQQVNRLKQVRTAGQGRLHVGHVKV